MRTFRVSAPSGTSDFTFAFCRLFSGYRPYHYPPSSLPSLVSLLDPIRRWLPSLSLTLVAPASICACTRIFSAPYFHRSSVPAEVAEGTISLVPPSSFRYHEQSQGANSSVRIALAPRLSQYRGDLRCKRSLLLRLILIFEFPILAPSHSSVGASLSPSALTHDDDCYSSYPSDQQNSGISSFPFQVRAGGGFRC